MIATATDRSRRWPRLCALAIPLLLGLVGCAEEPLPQRGLSVDNCLTRVELKQLETALKRCDQVVEAFPKQPQPLNERFVLHSLRGDEAAACRDIARAVVLARAIPPQRLDRVLLRELAMRQASCRG
ncbi:MAG: hypothetical protein ACKOXO_07380 [Cyanobium sp.]